jgi:hypothetical protein
VNDVSRGWERQSSLPVPDECSIDPSMLCDSCGAQMRWETSHSRCDRCGYIRPCCEGVPLEARPQSLPGSRS